MLTNRELETETSNNDYFGEPNGDLGFNFGYIQSSLEQKYLIECGNNKVMAIKAPSCLIGPKVGDYVALINDGQHSFIVAVLEQNENEASIDIKSDTEITMSAPSVRVLGTDNISFTGKQGHLACSDFKVTSRNMELVAETADTRIGALSHIGKTFKVVLADLLVRAATSLRVIDGPDHQRAKETSIKADKMLVLQGDLTSIIGKSDVKVDAERVHLG